MRSWTRSLAGGSVTTTTNKTTVTEKTVPSVPTWWDGNALPKSQCEFIACPSSEKDFTNWNLFISPKTYNFFSSNGDQNWLENRKSDWWIMHNIEYIIAKLEGDKFSCVYHVQTATCSDAYSISPNESLWSNSNCKAINEWNRIWLECCPKWAEQAPQFPTDNGGM